MWTSLAGSAAAADRSIVAVGRSTAVTIGSVAAGQSPASRRVKYYIVPRAGHGPSTLSEIAAQTLGDGTRFMQIFNLNKGRLQSNGGRLENPKVIDVGWVLELPADASGPGVHFGALPRPKPSKHPTPSPQPRSSSTSHPRAAAPSSSTAGFVIAGLALVVIGGLVVAGGLVLPRKGRRRRLAGPYRQSGPHRARRGHRALRPATPVILARTPERVPSRRDLGDRDLDDRDLDDRDLDDSGQWSWRAEAISPADWPADHPSRPQRAVDERDWPPDHPSRPQQAVDYRGWPADHPSRPQQAVDYQGWPHDGPAGPRGGAVGSQPVPARPAGFAGPMPTPHQAPHYAPQQAPQYAPQHHAPQHHAPQQYVPQQYAPHQAPQQELYYAQQAPYQPPVPAPLPVLAYNPPRTPWSTDTLRVASLLLSEAEAEASKIRAEASAVREVATAEAAAVRDEATAQATAVREAAEQEAQGLRASLTAMSAELGEVAALVTERLTIPGTLIAPDALRAKPAAPPTQTPPTEPSPATTTPTRKRPATPPAKPGKPSKPARPPKPTKPGQRPRQIRAVRMMVAACIGLTLFATVAGTTEIFLHGFAFFVFRSAGTGATPSNGLQESQGPGQPDAPGTHHHPVTRHHKAKAHKPKHHHTKHHQPARQHSG